MRSDILIGEEGWWMENYGFHPNYDGACCVQSESRVVIFLDGRDEDSIVPHLIDAWFHELTHLTCPLCPEEAVMYAEMKMTEHIRGELPKWVRNTSLS